MQEEKVTIREVYKLIQESQEAMNHKIDDGFKGVHQRQDKTNGNVLRNTEFRQQTQGSMAVIKFAITALGIGNIVALIKIFL